MHMDSTVDCLLTSLNSKAQNILKTDLTRDAFARLFKKFPQPIHLNYYLYWGLNFYWYWDFDKMIVNATFKNFHIVISN